MRTTPTGRAVEVGEQLLLHDVADRVVVRVPVEQVDGVGQHRQQRVEVVGDDHDRHVPLAVQVAEQPHDLLLVAQVEVGQRLVEQQQLGVVDDGLGDRHPLLLAAGELRHPAVGVVVGADPAQRLRRPGRARRPRCGAARTGRR